MSGDRTRLGKMYFVGFMGRVLLNEKLKEKVGVTGCLKERPTAHRGIHCARERSKFEGKVEDWKSANKIVQVQNLWIGSKSIRNWGFKSGSPNPENRAD